MNKKRNFIFGALFSALLLSVGFTSFRRAAKVEGVQCRTTSLQQSIAAVSVPGDSGPKAAVLG